MIASRTLCAIACKTTETGWCQFTDPQLMSWVKQVLPAARATVTAPENSRWHRCEGTWFTGVNVLPNDCQAAKMGRPGM